MRKPRYQEKIIIERIEGSMPKPTPPSRRT
jgi:hypothetical protein